MVINMNETRLCTIEQIEQFLGACTAGQQLFTSLLISKSTRLGFPILFPDAWAWRCPYNSVIVNSSGC